MSLTMRRLTGRDSQYYEESRQLYFSAFPENERMDMSGFLDETQQIRELYAFDEEGTFIGFAGFLNSPKISHVIYFAVEDAYRGRGYGSKLLKAICSAKAGQRVIVDVESDLPWKENLDERVKRMQFYLHNGFEKTKINYNWQGEDYDILSYGGDVTRADFHEFWRFLFGGRKEDRKHVQVAAAVIYRKGRIFATQRGYGEYKDWWEFPGGKVEPGETGKEALAREIREELDTEVEVGGKLTGVEYDMPSFHLSMECFWCTVISGRLTLKEHESARWLTEEELDTVKWLPADEAALGAVRYRMKQEKEGLQAERQEKRK